MFFAADGDAFMFIEFQRTIVGNGHYDPNAPRPPFWKTFTYLNAEMLRANAGIMQRHPWETVWYEWMLNLRGLLYYSYDQKHTYTSGMYLIGECCYKYRAEWCRPVSLALTPLKKLVVSITHENSYQRALPSCRPPVHRVGRVWVHVLGCRVVPAVPAGQARGRHQEHR